MIYSYLYPVLKFTVNQILRYWKNMQVRNKYIIILLFLFVSCKGQEIFEHPGKILPKAVNGVLDLTNEVISPHPQGKQQEH